VWLRGFEDRDEADHPLFLNLTCGVISFLACAKPSKADQSLQLETWLRLERRVEIAFSEDHPWHSYGNSFGVLSSY